MDLRCHSKLHGIIVGDNFIEFKCKSRWCGAGPGIAVIHRFDMKTGEPTTKLYKDPRRE